MALSLPIGIYTYLITRAFGAFNNVCSGLATGSYDVAGCGTATGAVITYRILSRTLLATKMRMFWAIAGALCINSSSYSMSCPVPSPGNLLVRLIIAKGELVQPGLKALVVCQFNLFRCHFWS